MMGMHNLRNHPPIARFFFKMTYQQGRKRLVLTVKPRRCGLLRLTGLRWRLFGEASRSLIPHLTNYAPAFIRFVKTHPTPP